MDYGDHDPDNDYHDDDHVNDDNDNEMIDDYDIGNATMILILIALVQY